MITWNYNVVQGALGVSVPRASYNLRLGAEGKGVGDTGADLVLDAAVAILSPDADCHARNERHQHILRKCFMSKTGRIIIIVQDILVENIIRRKLFSMNVYQLQNIGRNTFMENNFR